MADITLRHDDIPFIIRGVTGKKLRNWRVMSKPRRSVASAGVSAGLPYLLQIEPTNVCNLTCDLCPVADRALGRPPRHMSAAELSAILDDMEDHLLLLVLWDWGEPFANPAFPDMIRDASTRGIQTVTSTNAHYLDREEYVARVLTSGLGALIVAIDSLDEQQYRRFRRGGDLTRALAGLETTMQLRAQLGSRTRIHLRMVVTRGNQQEIGRMRSFAKAIGVDHFSVKTANPDCGGDSSDEEVVPDSLALRRYAYRPGTFERIRLRRPRCSSVWHLSNIHSNGDVVPCYDDFSGVHKLGNVFEHKLSELWNGPAYRALRRKIAEELPATPMCADCWINYRLSESGRLVSAHRFDRDLRLKLREKSRHLARSALHRLKSHVARLTEEET